MPTSSPSSSRPAPSTFHESVAQAFLPARQRHEHQKQEFSPSTPSTAKYAKKKRTASGKPGAGALLGFLGVLGGTWRTWREMSFCGTGKSPAPRHRTG